MADIPILQERMHLYRKEVKQEGGLNAYCKPDRSLELKTCGQLIVSRKLMSKRHGITLKIRGLNCGQRQEVWILSRLTFVESSSTPTGHQKEKDYQKLVSKANRRALEPENHVGGSFEDFSAQFSGIFERALLIEVKCTCRTLRIAVQELERIQMQEGILPTVWLLTLSIGRSGKTYIYSASMSD